MQTSIQKINSMVTAVGLPLLIVNGKFKSLGSMTVEDLETFIPFLVKCSVNRAGAQLLNGVPEWWSSMIKCKFPLQKPNGLSQTGYHKHLSSIVCSCYWYHDAQYLLPFCAKIAKCPESVFLKNNEDNTTSIFYVNNTHQILKFNNENKNYDKKPKKEKPSRRSLLSTLPRKSDIVPDIYLCENCDAECYSHSEMQKHEKECYDIVIDDVKNKHKKDIGGSGSGAENLKTINKKKQDNLYDEIEILEHIKPSIGPSIRKKDFFNYFMLQSKNNETITRLSKSENRTRPHYLHWMNVDCVHKSRGVEFSSLLGRKMSENSSKREVMNKIGRNFLINEYYCSTSATGRTFREHRESMDFKVTYKKSKRSAWTHQYCFNKKQKRSRLITLKTVGFCLITPLDTSGLFVKMATISNQQQAEEKVKKMFSWSASLSDIEINNMHDNPAYEGSHENLAAAEHPNRPPPLQTQQSTVHTRRQQAVCVRHAFKHYGSNKNPNHVLSNLNMTVAKGTIYGLLGASGCGKTTLLSCIVGRRRLNTGEIWVLGGRPGTKGSGVPGKRVGYMPQEIALYGEFSIKETMMYFGWIFGMDTAEINDRLQFLLNFLDLPSENRLVKNLSGGQQRRVSFAVALMHDPELLILDEPTVGVDPLLRQSIWTHLVQITKDGNKTVIITTHYIEEARQAHTIGLMRSGRLLAEESPQVLLTMYGCQSLEEVFLKLSRKQGSNNTNQGDMNISNNISLASLNWSKKDAIYVTEESGVVGLNFHQSKEALYNHENQNGLGNVHLDIKTIGSKASKAMDMDCDDCGNVTDCCKITTKGKIKALLQKNFLRMWRNVGVMLFIFALPVMQVILFCLAIGRDPTGLKLAVVNHEMNYNTMECPFASNCSFTNLSCRYLSHLNRTIIKEYYETPEKALDAVKQGEAWGALYFTENFTDALVARMALGRDADEETLDQSEIRVWLDMSNQQIGLMLNRDLQLTYREFAQEMLSQCEHNPKLADIPIQFKDPIYGSSDPSFTDFVAPGVILTIVFFLAVALTSSALIIERMEGLLDRSWVAGVTPVEILFSHVVTQFVVMCGQTALVLIFMICVFKVECNGPLHWIVILTILQGLCGMCFGFVISAICELERNAIQLALGSFYPTLLLSGVIWPVEGMPIILRYISLGLPLTMATSALRSMLTRGWDIEEPDVYNGFIATIIWIFIFLSISLLVLKFKRG